jgi:hypothetical protein
VDPPPWCESPGLLGRLLPASYSSVQARYWGQGLLRFWKPVQARSCHRHPFNTLLPYFSSFVVFRAPNRVRPPISLWGSLRWRYQLGLLDAPGAPAGGRASSRFTVASWLQWRLSQAMSRQVPAPALPNRDRQTDRVLTS